MKNLERKVSRMMDPENEVNNLQDEDTEENDSHKVGIEDDHPEDQCHTDLRVEQEGVTEEEQETTQF